MTDLLPILNVLAAGVVTADLNDPQGLAQLHEQFDAARKSAAQDSGLAVVLGRGTTLLEQVILQEVADAQAAMNQIVAIVNELQGSLSASPTAEPATTAEPTEPGPYDGAEPDFSQPGDAADLAREFIAEATTHIDAAEAALLALEENPDDLEPVKTLFRAVHTIKGTAGFVNLKQIPRLAHSSENLLDLARQGKIRVVGPVADLVLESIDRLKSMVSQLASAVERAGVQPTDAGLPGLLARIDAAARGEVTQPVTKAAAAPLIPAPASTTEVADAPTTVTPAAVTVEPPAPPAPAAAPQTPPAAEGHAPSRSGDATVKVATDRLDRLIDSVGELVIAQSMLEQSMTHGDGNAAASTARGLAHLGKLTRELQDLAMSMRMVPIQGVFQKMARLARDLTRKSEKLVSFAVHGGETELDRNLVEAISDPLVHMIRNAVDHGIETPDAREKAGKPREGSLQLHAYHQSGNVVIEIRDDGKGLVKSRILAKAIERGVIRADAQLSDQEIFALIFHAGLSTAEKVTDVSGRGVGMDVVKRNIESLRGRIEIESTEGKGTTFIVRLPLTLALIDGLVLRVGDQRFIVPLVSVEQSLRLSREQVSTVQGRGEMCLCRGSLLPIVRVDRVFGIAANHQKPDECLAVIVQDNTRRCCLLVDALVGRQQVVIKSLGETVGRPRGVAGGAILGDGRVSLILDVPSLIELGTSA